MSGETYILMVLAMAGAAFFCRAVGFLAMRYVPITPRMEAALKATPVSVMAGIVAIAVFRGGAPEWIATVAVLLLVRLTGNEILAAFGGIIAIALMRAAGA